MGHLYHNYILTFFALWIAIALEISIWNQSKIGIQKNKTEKDSVAACENQKDDKNHQKPRPSCCHSAEKRMSIALAVLLGDFGQHSLAKCV